MSFNSITICCLISYSALPVQLLVPHLFMFYLFFFFFWSILLFSSFMMSNGTCGRTSFVRFLFDSYLIMDIIFKFYIETCLASYILWTERKKSLCSMLCEQNKGTAVKINVPKALHKLHFKSRFLRQPNRMSKLNQNVSGCMLDISEIKRAYPSFNT